MLDRRRPHLVAVGAALALLMGSAPPALAGSAVTAVVDVASTTDGPQLVIRIDGGNGILVRAHGDAGLTVTETGDWGVRIAPGAASRCQPDPEAEYTVFCDRSGLLTATATRKPIRFEMSTAGGHADAYDSPLPIEAQGGPGADAVSGSRFDDVIRLGDGNDSSAGWDGNDLIELGGGIDQSRGGPGDDRIDGGEDPDWIEGDAGRDRLIGGAGDDLLMGEPNAGDSWGGSDLSRVNDADVETVDDPADCGGGDDTVVQRTAQLDPVLANCEHTLLHPAGAPLSIQGTATVGATLRAVRPPVGVEPSYRAYLWLSCTSISYGAFSSGCLARSNCPTFRLEPRDADRQIMLITRITYTLAGGQYKVQPGDEYVWTQLPVGESSEPLAPNFLDRWISAGYAWLYVDGVGQQDRTGDLPVDLASGGQDCSPPTPTPTPTPAATPVSPKPTAATPVATAAPTPLNETTASQSPQPTPAVTAPPTAPAQQRSSSRTLCKVPSVVGLSERAARRRLTRNGCAGRVVRTVVRRRSRIVTKQSPAGGTRAQGYVVRLVVSR